MSLSEATAAAKAKGFTEPDPRDDLSGMDVARKLLTWPVKRGFPLNYQILRWILCCRRTLMLPAM